MYTFLKITLLANLLSSEDSIAVICHLPSYEDSIVVTCYILKTPLFLFEFSEGSIAVMCYLLKIFLYICYLLKIINCIISMTEAGGESNHFLLKKLLNQIISFTKSLKTKFPIIFTLFSLCLYTVRPLFKTLHNTVKHMNLPTVV